MKPVKQYPLRRIAENELTTHFGDLDDAVKNDLALSLVRQWLTNDGHAGLVTLTRQFWFHFAPGDDSLAVGFSTSERNWGVMLTREWGVDEDEIPGLLHQLNLCQSVVCRTGDDRTFRLSIEAKEQIVRCQEQPAATQPRPSPTFRVAGSTGSTVQSCPESILPRPGRAPCLQPGDELHRPAHELLLLTATSQPSRECPGPTT